MPSIKMILLLLIIFEQKVESCPSVVNVNIWWVVFFLKPNFCMQMHGMASYVSRKIHNEKLLLLPKSWLLLWCWCIVVILLGMYLGKQTLLIMFKSDEKRQKSFLFRMMIYFPVMMVVHHFYFPVVFFLSTVQN